MTSESMRDDGGDRENRNGSRKQPRRADDEVGAQRQIETDDSQHGNQRRPTWLWRSPFDAGIRFVRHFGCCVLTSQNAHTSDERYVPAGPQFSQPRGILSQSLSANIAWYRLSVIRGCPN